MKMFTCYFKGGPLDGHVLKSPHNSPAVLWKSEVNYFQERRGIVEDRRQSYTRVRVVDDTIYYVASNS